MKRVVITGSTRGIGLGLAREFLRRGCAVAISGRNRDGMDEALQELASLGAADRLLGVPCDVRRADEVRGLWDEVAGQWGGIDLWICNAGVSHPIGPLQGCSAETIDQVLATNLGGTLHCCRVALDGMNRQGFGALYNMEGLGSDGRKVPGMALYGITKAGVRYLTVALAAETEGSRVIVGAISPGMVVTELLTSPYDACPAELEKVSWLFRILADRVETVAPWLVDRILANRRNGARICWLTPAKIMARFLTSCAKRRDPFAPVP